MATRREIASQRAQLQAIAQTRIAAASDATVVTAQIDAAVSGDLIASSPQLAAKFQEIEERLSEIAEPDQ